MLVADAPFVPLLGRMSRLQMVRTNARPHIIRRDWHQCVCWVSCSARVAAFMRTFFLGYDAGALWPAYW